MKNIAEHVNMKFVVPEKSFVFHINNENNGKFQKLTYHPSWPIGFPVFTSIKVIYDDLTLNKHISRIIESLRNKLQVFGNKLEKNVETLEFEKEIRLNEYYDDSIYDKAHARASSTVLDILDQVSIQQLDIFSLNIQDICRWNFYMFFLELYSALFCLENYIRAERGQDASNLTIKSINPAINDLLAILLPDTTNGTLKSTSRHFQEMDHARDIRGYASQFVNLFNNVYKNNANKNFSHVDVLFFVYTPNHIKTVLPLIDFLRKQNNVFSYAVLIMDINSGKDYLDLLKRDVRLIYFNKYRFDLKKIDEIKRMYENKYIERREEGSNISKDKDNGKINDMVNLIYEKFKHLFVTATYQFYKMEALLNILEPKEIILFNEIIYLGRIITKIANERNIKTIYIPHGAITERTGYAKVETTKVLIDGVQEKEVLVHLGTPDEKMIMTGRPINDIIFNKYITKGNSCKKRTYERYNIAKDKKLVVLCSGDSFVGKEKEDFIGSVVNCIKTENEYSLIIKLHPTENSDVVVNVLQSKDFTCPVIRDIDIYEVISSADVIIANHSTVQIESVILGKPPINLDLLKTLDYYKLMANGVCQQASTEEELKEAIRRALFDEQYLQEFHENRKKYLAKRFRSLDGKACERITNVILDDVRSQ